MGRLVPEWDKEWPCCVTEAEEMASLTPDRALSLTHTPHGRERDTVGKRKGAASRDHQYRGGSLLSLGVPLLRFV